MVQQKKMVKSVFVSVVILVFNLFNIVSSFGASEKTTTLPALSQLLLKSGASLVQDFDSSADGLNAFWAFPPTVFNDKIWFAGYDNVEGWELWSSDGSSTGTKRITDIEPGNSDAYFVDPVVYHGDLYFIAFTSSYGRELWKLSYNTATDSYSANLVIDIDGTSADSCAASVLGNGNLLVFDDKLFFIADDGLHDKEVWFSDGTQAGTHPVRDFVTILSANPDDVSHLTVLPPYGARLTPMLIFSGRESSTGREPYSLYKAPGGNYEITLLKDIRSFTSDSNPSPLVDNAFTYANGLLFFKAEDNIHGKEIWRTDGTSAGTKLIKDIEPGGDSSSVHSAAVMADRLFFAGTTGGNTYSLFKTDGTSSGTDAIFTPPVTSGAQSVVVHFADTKDLYFTTFTDETLSPFYFWKTSWSDSSASWVAEQLAESVMPLWFFI